MATFEQRANPFGNAKPRETCLAEKGVDWRAVDERVERKAEEHQHLFLTPAHLARGEDGTISKKKIFENDDVTSIEGADDSSSSSSHSYDPFGTARPREEVLAKHGVDPKQIDERIEKRAAGGEHVFAPSQQNGKTTKTPPEASRSKIKSNPFGSARPREEVLAKKGIDYRQVDKRLEKKAAATHLTPEQEAEAEVLRQELTKAEEDYWDANEHEMPEENFRIICETKRKTLHDLLAKFSELNLEKAELEKASA